MVKTPGVGNTRRSVHDVGARPGVDLGTCVCGGVETRPGANLGTCLCGGVGNCLGVDVGTCSCGGVGTCLGVDLGTLLCGCMGTCPGVDAGTCLEADIGSCPGVNVGAELVSGEETLCRDSISPGSASLMSELMAFALARKRISLNSTSAGFVARKAPSLTASRMRRCISACRVTMSTSTLLR